MIVRTLKDAQASDRRVRSDNWESTRLLLKNDQMGFSFHITTILPGQKLISGTRIIWNRFTASVAKVKWKR